MVLLAVYLIFKIQVNATFALQYMLLAVLFSLMGFGLCSTYNIVIRHTDFKDTLRFALAALIKVLLLTLTWLLVGNFHLITVLTLSADLVLTFIFLMLFRFIIVSLYDFYKAKIRERMFCKRILVYGTSDLSISLIARFKDSPQYEIVGFLVPQAPQGRKLAGVRCYEFSSREDLAQIAGNLSLRAVIFSRDADAASEQDRLVKYATELGLEVLITPETQAYSSGLRVREVNIEDLLERPVIRLSTAKMEDYFKGRVVMVSGAAGSIGSQLCRQIASFGIKKLILFDNAETPMHQLRLEMEERFPELDFVPVVGDVRSKRRLDFVMRNWRPQIVFHAAAYKHVPLMEENPCEAVRVNVSGTRNIADKCVEYGVERMVMISTDKAVNPTNVMGCTKRIAEIYVQSLGLHLASLASDAPHTEFVTTRFGNVLGSNGSVIPRFREQIMAGGPVTVTDPRITRFFMTIPEACSLVMEAAVMSDGNEIFVFDMGDAVKIDHLARRMIELAGFVPDKDIKIVYTGLRPGEKLYEEVLSDKENTLPTSHERIRIARVRDYPYEQAAGYVNRLNDLAKAVEAEEMVRLMKEVVPEYISNNSAFEALDRKNG